MSLGGDCEGASYVIASAAAAVYVNNSTQIGIFFFPLINIFIFLFKLTLFILVFPFSITCLFFL